MDSLHAVNNLWGRDVVNADRYRSYADECRAVAKQLSSEDQRRTLLSIAEAWDNLAEPKSDRTSSGHADYRSPGQWLRSAMHTFF